MNVVFLLFLFFFFSCIKKQIPPEKEPYIDKCQPRPNAPMTGWKFRTQNHSKNLIYAFLNPNNVDEIFYLAENALHDPSDLHRLNLSTKDNFIIDNNVLGHPQINKNNWVLYYKPNKDLYKAKFNPDSLIRITQKGSCEFPQWDSTGTKIFFFNLASIPKNNSLQVITDSGIPIDTFPGIGNVVTSIKSNKIAYFKIISESHQLVVKNLNDLSETIVWTRTLEEANLNPIKQIFLNENGMEIYWLKSEGLYVKNLATLTERKLIKSCPMQVYESFSVTSGTIVGCRTDLKVLSVDSLYYESNAFKFNLDGSIIGKIEIP